MEERRRFERRSVTIRVEISHPSIGTMMGTTSDISDGGAAVVLENQPLPPLGTEVLVRFHRLVGTINDEPVPMKVMHQNRNVIGLMFLPRD